MNRKISRSPDFRFIGLASRITALLAAVSATSGAFATDLIKADNTTELGTVGSYAAPNDTAVPTTSDRIVFDGTLVTNSTFSWTNNRSVQGVKLNDPANAVTVNLSGATFNLNNLAGNVTVIDLSSATKNLTFAASSTAALLQVRGSSTSGGAFVSVGSGATLTIQSNFNYNNGTGTPTIRLTGAGNFTVNGTNGRISDKTAGTALTAFSLDNTFAGTATFSNANTYSGGTSISGGTLVAGVAGAVGGGGVTVGGGTLDLNGSGIVNLTLAANKDFAFTSGTLKFNLGTSYDQITGSGTGKFNLTGGAFAITQGAGFDYGVVYQVFSGFTSGTSTVSGLSFTGFDTGAYTASLNNLGQLSFSAISIPEPSTYAAIAGFFVLAGTVGRRRLKRGV
ncbi:MAG: autotransporter-associated beta strand repeat-containing protein [Opitutaceae bacterium]|jgi:autotransporter-associated beta strand protein